VKKRKRIEPPNRRGKRDRWHKFLQSAEYGAAAMPAPKFKSVEAKIMTPIQAEPDRKQCEKCGMTANWKNPNTKPQRFLCEIDFRKLSPQEQEQWVPFD
jgi:formylmethanofuran dehydrogenase subunit E